MAVLLDHHGRPIQTTIQNKKAAPPKLGEAFGNWAGRDDIMTLPGGGLLQFNLDGLTLDDFRQMKDHYQVNASISILTFMMHQLDYRIICTDQKIVEHVESNMHDIWGRLVRAMGQAFWAGYSPNVLEWENELVGNKLKLNKVKDLRPEECEVEWERLEGWAPPGKKGPIIKRFNGIRQSGTPYPVPVSNSFWYTLLMENGDYNGKKLLRSAFTPWFFSHLVHLFSNRYFERFGEPLPVGRAPYDETIDVRDANGNIQAVPGNVVMEQAISQIRSRSVVVLPNDKTIGSDNQRDWDYQLEYLESQMRGADFERYLTRLDEEISLALFTPLLLMRTGDVGSYSLGEQHTKTWLWALNALAADWAEYINRYIISPMISYNFSDRAPRAYLEFRKQGKTDAETVRALITALIKSGAAKPNMQELGQIAGLTLEEVAEVTSDDPDQETSEDDEGEEGVGSGNAQDKLRLRTPRKRLQNIPQAHATGDEIVARVESQVSNAFRKSTFGGGFTASLGYKRRFTEALKAHGVENADAAALAFYQRVELWVENVACLGVEEFPTPEAFMGLFKAMLTTEIERIA